MSNHSASAWCDRWIMLWKYQLWKNDYQCGNFSSKTRHHVSNDLSVYLVTRSYLTTRIDERLPTYLDLYIHGLLGTDLLRCNR